MKNITNHVGILAAMLLMGCAPQAMSQRVLLDNYYNNEWKKDAAGAMVRYHYVWSDTTNSGFSQLGRIIKDLGGSLDTLCQAPAEQLLRRGDIYLIVDPDTPQETADPHYVQKAEADQIEAWVKAGGTLLLFGNDKGNAEFEHFNLLAERFGMHFNEVSRNRVQGNNYATGAFDSLPAHPLFEGVGKLFLKEVSTLHLSAPAKPLLVSGGDVIMASSEFGKGFVFAVCDPWLYNEYMDHRRLPADYENDLAGKNLFRWLFGRTRAAEEQRSRNSGSITVPFAMPSIRVPNSRHTG